LSCCDYLGSSAFVMRWGGNREGRHSSIEVSNAIVG
jgi:hypothetical protein